MREKVKNSAIWKCCKTLIMDFYLDNSSCEKTKKWLYSLLCSFIFLSVYIFVYTVDKFEWPILTIVLLGILIFCSGIVIVHIIWLDERPASITIRLLRDLVVGVVFITLFYSMGFKFSASEGLQVYLGHVSVFIIGFLFGELIFGYFEIAQLNREIIDSIKTVNITTEKITAKIGNELIEYRLKKFLPGLQYTGVFSGHHNIGIFKIETVSFVNYSDMATNLLKKAHHSLYTTHVIPPGNIMGNRINYKIFFDTFADEKEVKVPKENRKHIVVVPLNDRPLWEDQAEFKKFVEEWLHYDKSIDNVRILTDYSRKPKLYYGDILIVDDNVALSFDLYEKYDASHSNGNLGILMLSTGDILREYSKIFSDEYYKELSTPEEYYELLNNK